MENTILDGDDLVFTPDDATIRRYRDAFARLKIYPGYRGAVVRATSDLIRIGDTLKAWPANQFRPSASFGPGEIEAYRDAAEHSMYAMRGFPPLKIGDKVRFQPSELCDLLHRDCYMTVGLYATYQGVVTGIGADSFVEVDGLSVRLHASEFVPISK